MLPKYNFGNLLHECEHVSIKLKILGDASTSWLLSSFKEYGINYIQVSTFVKILSGSSERHRNKNVKNKNVEK